MYSVRYSNRNMQKDVVYLLFQIQNKKHSVVIL